MIVNIISFVAEKMELLFDLSKHNVGEIEELYSFPEKVKPVGVVEMSRRYKDPCKGQFRGINYEGISRRRYR